MDLTPWITHGIVLVVGGVLGAIFGGWYSVILHRPRLKVTGVSSGGSPTRGYSNSVQITNEHGVVGVNPGETVLFGWRLHGRIQRGAPFERTSAAQCRATIRAVGTNYISGGLLWLDASGAGTANEVTIHSGESYQLMLFGRLPDEPTKFFLWAPDETDPRQFRMPQEHEKFDARSHGPHQFLVTVSHSYGHQTMAFPVTVRWDFDGWLRWDIGNGRWIGGLPS